MIEKICVSQELFRQAVDSLKVPHPVAFERVGYFLGGIIKHSFVVDDWFTFEDQHYQDSEVAGAEINRLGMKHLMELALMSKKSLVQFHLHEFQKLPSFSRVDQRSIDDIIPALFSYGTKAGHGAMIKGMEFTKVLFWTHPDCPQELIVENHLLTGELYEPKK